MRRIMVTVTDMTVPSRPGREHVFSYASDDLAEITEELGVWTRNRITDVLAGDTPEDDVDPEDDGAEGATAQAA